MTIRVWKLQSNMHVGVLAECLEVKEVIRNKLHENLYALQATVMKILYIACVFPTSLLKGLHVLQ